MVLTSTLFSCLLASLCSLASADDAAAPSGWVQTEPSDFEHFPMPCEIRSLGSGVGNPLEKTCGWTATCSVEGCEDRCIPNEQTYHQELESLFQIKSMTSLKCSLVAGMVKQFGHGLFGNARRMLRSESPSKEKAAGSTLAHKVAQTIARVTAASSKEAHTAEVSQFQVRHLTDASMDTVEADIPCPTDEEIDAIAPILEFVKALLSGDTSLFGAIAGSADYETDEEPFDMMLQEVIGSLLTSTEDLKAMMANECKTEVVDSEPMLSMYLSIIGELDSEGSFGAEAPVASTEQVDSPDSVIACRPKGGEDMAAIQAQAEATLACEPAAASITNGMCMSESVLSLLHPACYDVGANFLGVSAENSASLHAALTSVHDACTAATTQSACQAVDQASMEADVGSIVENVKEEVFPTMDDPAEPSEAADSIPFPTEPSHADVNSGTYAMAITTALAAVAAL